MALQGRTRWIRTALWLVLLFYMVPVFLGFGWDLVRQFRIEDPGRWYFSGAHIQHGFSAYDAGPSPPPKPCGLYDGFCPAVGNDIFSRFLESCWDAWQNAVLVPSIDLLENGWNLAFAIHWVRGAFLVAMTGTLVYVTRKVADLLVEAAVARLRTRSASGPQG